MSDKHATLRRSITLVMTLAALSGATFLGTYHLGQFTVAAAYCIAIVGLNIVVGTAGQVSLAQGAFFAIGAYAIAIFRIRYGVPFPLGLLAAGLVTSVVGFVAGLPALRLRGHYLAIVTLGLAVAVLPIANRWSSLTGGGAGLNLGQVSVPAGVAMSPEQYLYIWAMVLAAAAIVIAWRVVRSPLGIAMSAVRDNEIAAMGMGVDLRWIKTGAFAASAFFGGVGGGVFALSVGFVAPENFLPTLSLLLLVGIIIGGSGFVPGSILGALFVQFVPDYAAALNKHLAGVFFGAAIILFIRFMPEGPLKALPALFGTRHWLFFKRRGT
ncbi:MAG: branched-chain amino acid ABC transporter permease [Betaproteobacteria bacterium]|nr:MAG: branched-chain amino acid ABC transporter permease [Betaproteobacteria bacterium]